MGKVLFWAVVILLVLLVSRIISHQKAQARRVAEHPSSDPAAASEMVRCAHCQIHLPRAEAYFSQGKTWCSAEHARKGLRH